MNQRFACVLGAFLQVAAGIALPDGLTAQITVLTSGGFADAYQELRPKFEKAHNLTITTLRGASQGTGATAIAADDTEIAVLPVSELRNKPGVDFIGTIPPDLQLVQTFSAAVLADSKESRLSKQLIAFLTSETARTAIRNSGMEPAGSR